MALSQRWATGRGGGGTNGAKGDGGHLESLAVSSPQFRTHILEETCFVIFLNWMGGLQFMGDEEDNVGCCLFDFKARETVQITLFYSYTQNLHTVFKNVHRKVSNF